MAARRIGVIADSHFHFGLRWEECVRVHDWIVRDGAERGVELWLHAGDIYERASTPDERRAVAAWVQRATDVAPMVLVRGNHDAPRDLEILARLETRFPVIVEEAFGVHVVAGVAVAALAWPQKAAIMAGARSIAEADLEAAESLRAVLRHLGAELDRVAEGLPRLLVAHAMTRGSETSAGQPLVGCDFELGIEDISLARADLYALGHIHKGQSWTHGAPIVYPGSPRRTAFGEIEPKGYLIVDASPGSATWKLVETPCAPMFLGEDAWDGERGRFEREWAGLPETVEGAELRLRFTVAAEHMDAACKAAENVRSYLLEMGAVHVKIDPVPRPTSVARAPEVARAKRLGDKLLALWKARDAMPEQAAAASMLEMADELDSEVA